MIDIFCLEVFRTSVCETNFIPETPITVYKTCPVYETAKSFFQLPDVSYTGQIGRYTSFRYTKQVLFTSIRDKHEIPVYKYMSAVIWCFTYRKSPMTAQFQVYNGQNDRYRSFRYSRVWYTRQKRLVPDDPHTGFKYCRLSGISCS